MTTEAKKISRKNLVLAVAVLVLVFTPLMLYRSADFGGADGAVEKVITEVSPAYRPWFHSRWGPPSGEIESLLFALQAALGSGFIGYYFGYARGKRKGREKDRSCFK